jgi:hypothetical protein
VEAAPTSQHPWRVCISPGYVLDPLGNEIYLAETFPFDIAGNWPTPDDPCRPARPSTRAGPGSRTYVAGPALEARTAFLAICYDECRSRPVRVHPAGCGCEESNCEYSRVRDSFCVAMLPDLPLYQQKGDEADAQWIKNFKQWAELGSKGPRPIAPCPDAPDDPCVVLAKVTLPASQEPLAATSIDNNVRRVLYSTHLLQGVIGIPK